MVRGRSKIGSILFAVAWLAVVGTAVALTIARRETQGVYTNIIILGMAAFMLVIFVVRYLPKRLQSKSATDIIGKLSLGLLLLFVIVLLAVSLLTGYRNFGIFGSAVMLFFLVTFVRIFVDYLRDMGIRFGPRERKGEKGDE